MNFMQHYQLDSYEETEYCLIFNLPALKGSYIGRILTDISFTSIDLEDLFKGHHLSTFHR